MPKLMFFISSAIFVGWFFVISLRDNRNLELNNKKQANLLLVSSPPSSPSTDSGPSAQSSAPSSPTTAPSPTLTQTANSTANPKTILPIVINEIGWMGTQADDTDEWLELFNPNNSAVDLSGWTLRSLTGNSPDPNISLSGEISANGYYLLERSNDSTISDIQADKIYTGSLSNTGEILELRNNNGAVQDKVEAWYGGSNQKTGSIWQRFSMERIDSLKSGSDPANWGTNNGVNKNGLDSGQNQINGTPKAKNSI